MRAAEINDLQGSYGTIDNSAIWAKVSRYNLDTLQLNLQQLQPPRVSGPKEAKAILDRVRLFYNKKVMVNLVPTDFDPDLTPEQEANTMADFIDAVGYQNTTLTAKFDDERKGADGIKRLLRQWRTRKALRETIWTPEGMQGGWIADRENSGELPSMINMDSHFRIARQNYVDNMFPRDGDATLKDPVSAGINIDKITQATGAVSSTSPDVKMVLPIDWQGIVFTLEELA